MNEELINIDNFCVTLWSNAQMDLFPANSPSNFRNQLPETLAINSSAWTVCLNSLFYDHKWKNLEHHAQVSLRLPPATPSHAAIAGNLLALATSTPIQRRLQPRSSTMGDDSGYVQIDGDDIIVNAPVTLESLDGEHLSSINNSSGMTVVLTVSIPPGHYSSRKAVAKRICFQINRLFESEYPNRAANELGTTPLLTLQRNTNGDGSRVFHSEIDNAEFVFYKNHHSEDLLRLLGWNRIRFNNDTDVNDTMSLDVNSTDGHTSFKIINRPLKENTCAIHVLSTIVRNEVVAGELLPILLTLPSDPKLIGERCQCNMRSPRRKHLRSDLTSCTTIDIHLHDQNGRELKFESTTSAAAALPTFVELEFSRRLPVYI